MEDSKKKYFFLSPHPDDAVWSCGGRIAKLIKAGNHVTIVTIFDGDPPIKLKYEKWRTIASPALRRVENHSALRMLGAHHISLGFVDAALRTKNNHPVYPTPEHLLNDLHQDDEALIEKLSSRLQDVLYDDTDNIAINAPLGLGGHVDHILLHKAVMQITPKFVIWYEDFPYPFIKPGSNFTPAWKSVNIEDWLNAGLCYRSQIIRFWGNNNAFCLSLKKHAATRGQEKGIAYAERYWQQKKSRKEGRE